MHLVVKIKTPKMHYNFSGNHTVFMCSSAGCAQCQFSVCLKGNSSICQPSLWVLILKFCLFRLLLITHFSHHLCNMFLIISVLIILWCRNYKLQQPWQQRHLGQGAWASYSLFQRTWTEQYSCLLCLSRSLWNRWGPNSTGGCLLSSAQSSF